MTLVLLLYWTLGKLPKIDRRLTQATQSMRLGRSLLRTVISIGLLSSVVTAPNIQTAYTDLTKVAPAYNDFMVDRFQTLLEVQDSGALAVVSQYKNPPETIHFLDIISADGEMDFAGCFADYFGVTLQVIDDIAVEEEVGR